MEDTIGRIPALDAAAVGIVLGRSPYNGNVGDVEAVRRYHQRTMHRPGQFAPGPGFIDWAHEPDPFRRYAGAPTAPLPLADLAHSPTWAALHEPGAVAPSRRDRASLGAFFELALGLTAWKETSGARWALRANPSSGNLHPTEGYLLVPEVPGVACGLYHYSCLDHVLERRCSPTPASAGELSRWLPGRAFLVGLASIHWREAWKYGERAFRYCQHDIGHALAAIRYASAVLGWAARLLDAPGDEDVAAILGLDREDDVAELAPQDRERPAALVIVAGPEEIDEATRSVEHRLDALRDLVQQGTWSGRPNALGSTHVAWPEMDAVAHATLKPRTTGERGGPGAMATLAGRAGQVSAVGLIRQRRSAVAMDGVTSTPASAFFSIMAGLVPQPRVPPWDVLAGAPAVQPLVCVHRVDGLTPGLYFLDRGARQGLRESLADSWLWQPCAAAPDGLRLLLLEEGDVRRFAALASCQQTIAGDSAFCIVMLAAFADNLAMAPWSYRRLFWEAGILGHALYMEAEAHGLRGTGIGCFFDDVVHDALGLSGDRFKDLYHFTVGGAIDDPRLASRPAYGAEIARR